MASSETAALLRNSGKPLSYEHLNGRAVCSADRFQTSALGAFVYYRYDAAAADEEENGNIFSCCFGGGEGNSYDTIVHKKTGSVFQFGGKRVNSRSSALSDTHGPGMIGRESAMMLFEILQNCEEKLTTADVLYLFSMKIDKIFHLWDYSDQNAQEFINILHRDPSDRALNNNWSPSSPTATTTTSTATGTGTGASTAGTTGGAGQPPIVDESSAKRTEIALLAVMLKCDENDLTFLQKTKATSSQLSNLRIGVQKAMSLEDSPLWKNLASVSYMYRIVPGFAINKSVGIMGPQFCSNLVRYVNQDDAVGISLCVDPSLTVEMAPYLDPSDPHIQGIIEKFPVDLQRKLIECFLERKYYFQMARYADALPEYMLDVYFQYLRNPAQLLQVSRYSQNHERVIKFAKARFSTAELQSMAVLVSQDPELEKALTWIAALWK